MPYSKDMIQNIDSIYMLTDVHKQFFLMQSEVQTLGAEAKYSRVRNGYIKGLYLLHGIECSHSKQW